MKNAYDADASAVLVRFVGPLRKGQGKVEVIDTGHGMTLETLRGAWMEPATEWKRDRPRSEKFGRRVLGEKGLGRFAAARVADYFYVTTRREGGDAEARVLLNWSDFDEPDRYLDEIMVLWERVSPTEIVPGGERELLLRRLELVGSETFSQGTILSLEDLRKDWDSDDLAVLQRALSRLISPFSESTAAAFAIYLDMPEDFRQYSGLVTSPKIFSKPEYVLEGNVGSDGLCHLQLGRPDELIKIDKRLVLRKERTPQCGPFKIRLRAWSRGDALRPIADEMNISLRELRSDLDAVTGVYLYRDNFRILPYGEPGTDWLGLDRRRVNNPQMRFSNNQLSCHVFISADENSALIDQSNREGLFDNQAKNDLQELLIQIIAELELVKLNDRPPIQKAQQLGLFDGLTLEPVKAAVLRDHPGNRELVKLVDEQQGRIDGAVEKVKTVLSQYHRLSTLGSLVDKVLHEGRGPVSNIRYDVDELRSKLETATPEALPFLVPSVVKTLNEIDSAAGVLESSFRQLDPFSGRKRGRPQNVVLEDLIRAGVALVDNVVREVGAVVITPNSNTVVRVDPADIQIVIRNLVDNSLHWLTHVPAGQRVVEITVAKPHGDLVQVEVSDSGPGIPDEDRDRIWEAYYSKKPDGTGLGLVIAGDIVKEIYNGDLQLLDEGSQQGATFRFSLKKRI